MKSRFCARALCFLMVCLGLAAADSLELRNGRHLQGKYLGGSSTMIGFMTDANVEYFATSDVLALIFDRIPDTPLGGIQPESSTQPAPMNGSAASQKDPTLLRAGVANTNRNKRSRFKELRTNHSITD